MPMGRSASVAALLLTALVCRPARAQPMPDLVLDTTALANGVTFDLHAFAPDACELQAADLCVDAAGTRKLLRFDVAAINQGTADITLGDPAQQPPPVDQHGNPLFVYSQCHGHYHFQSFARYELRVRGQATLVKAGSKRAFCVEDTRAVTSTAIKKYTCSNQGIQVGWSDVYPNNLPCQWIDITDVAPGDYDLWVFLNTEQILPESDYTNDSGMTPVTIAGPDVTHPAPVVRLKAPHGHRTRHAGKVLTIRWQAHAKHGIKFQDVLFSNDGGTTWSLVANTSKAKIRRYRWEVPVGTATAQAMIRVAVWSTDDQRGTADSASFTITP